MNAVKTVGTSIKYFMILFSFIVSLVLVLVVVALMLTIYDLKREIAQPLVDGLHSSFVGLDEATIDWTIPVRDTIPVRMTVPLETETVVTLTENVPLVVTATITLPGVGVLNNAIVNLQLPQGLNLPVELDLDVPIDEQLDVALDVRAVIPLSETQLHDPVQNLRLMFEPLSRVLYNLPDDMNEGMALVGALFSGQSPDLLAHNPDQPDPWPGFSRTAGFGYSLVSAPMPQLSRPIETGYVARGGIPALDMLLRPEIYQQGGPDQVNERAQEAMLRMSIPAPYYNGSYAASTRPARSAAQANVSAITPVEVSSALTGDS